MKLSLGLNDQQCLSQLLRGSRSSVLVTWPIKGYKLMWNLFAGAQRNEIHVLHLLQVVGNHPETLTTAEVGIEESVGDLVFLRLRGEANQTNLL